MFRLPIRILTQRVFSLYGRRERVVLSCRSRRGAPGELAGRGAEGEKRGKTVDGRESPEGESEIHECRKYDSTFASSSSYKLLDSKLAQAALSLSQSFTRVCVGEKEKKERCPCGGGEEERPSSKRRKPEE